MALAPAAANAAGQLRAGAASVDASWHVGASAGQYASDGTFASVEEGDPSQHSTRRAPSYGIQSRLSVRAIVVQGPGGNRYAVVKNDFYIPQDLIWRRTAQLLEDDKTGIGRQNLTMAVTHDHSSPMYSSTSWGVWTFQDVFDFRFFEYYADRMRDAVELAIKRLEPVKVGASVTQYAFPQRNVPGPSRADDGTPAGFPNDYTDHDMIVTRFDSLKTGKPIANLVNWAVHPEDLEGNDLISGDYVAHVQRMADRVTGAVTIWTQGAVGNTEPEDNRWHPVHERAYFSHAQYAQSELEAQGIANHIVDTSNDVARNTPEDPSRFVPMRSTFENGEIAFENRWFPGPASHPYPGVSSCHTESALQGDPRAPIVGLPECEGPPVNPIEESGMDPGITTDTIKQYGIPVPSNYSAPAYTGLEEDVSVHLQAFRIGDILYTVCSCEQWADQSKDIKTRTDRVPGNQWVGYDWFPQCVKQNDGTYGDGPLGYGSGNWTCPNPGGGQLKDLPDKLVQRFHAQVTNPANGWDEPLYAPYAESEPADLKAIKGNYTHDDTPATPDAVKSQNAALGYKLTVAMAMANDYNGYIVTYREYQRGDHYRKSLTAWGPHSSDYMATRLVNMGRWLRDPSKPDPYPPMPTSPDIVNEWGGGGAKVKADLQNNDNRQAVIGQFAQGGIQAYEAQLPDDTTPKAVTQPSDVERFGAAFFRWNGGSNYTDMPDVKVQRQVDGKWEDYADQSGELPVTLKFPSAGELPAYRQGGYSFPWTAHFEVFVSGFDPPDRPQATPRGTYRFTVDGRYRKGGAVKTYRLESRSFQVGVWTGIKANDLRSDGGVVSFAAGPRHTYDVPRSGGGSPLKAEIGPIDYPDTYGSSLKAKFIDPRRDFFRDSTAPNDPSKIEWYCRPDHDDDAIKAHGCSFRPWMDFGDAERAIVTFVDRSGDTHRVAARESNGRWVATRKLGSGESAYVESGDVCDRFGDYNAGPTGAIGSKVSPKNPPVGYSCLPKASSGGGAAGGAGGSAALGKNPLGLPSTKKCLDRRKWRFRIHQPRKRKIVSVNVYVNGKRRFHKHAKRVTRVVLKKLPKKRFTVKIVAISNRGDRIVSVRRYKACKKGRPKTRVHRHKKHRKKKGGKHRVLVLAARR